VKKETSQRQRLICALLQSFESLAGRCSQSELGRSRHICPLTYSCTARQTRIDTVLLFRSDDIGQVTGVDYLRMM
jgi:hypothetical protein